MQNLHQSAKSAAGVFYPFFRKRRPPKADDFYFAVAWEINDGTAIVRSTTQTDNRAIAIDGVFDDVPAW